MPRSKPTAEFDLDRPDQWPAAAHPLELDRADIGANDYGISALNTLLRSHPAVAERHHHDLLARSERSRSDALTKLAVFADTVSEGGCMFVIIGWVVVLAAVIGSFVFEGGHVLALLQPFELMCIFGAAIGAFVVSNPPKVIKAVLKALPSCFGSTTYGKDKYLQLIALLYELLQKARFEGFLALETDINDPAASPIFAKYPPVKDDSHLSEFIVDYLRMMISGNMNVLEIQELMDAELETHHAEREVPATAIQRMADALPAYGIVAAVMGVVHTMGSVGQPPKVLGEMVAAALVGTFLGILLGYGFVGPLASVLEANAIENGKPYECVKTVLIASMSGYSPTIAVEFGRKVLFTVDRPSFAELEEAVKQTKNALPVPDAIAPEPAPV